jgi:hypothetical protein
MGGEYSNNNRDVVHVAEASGGAVGRGGYCMKIGDVQFPIRLYVTPEPLTVR